MSEEKDEKEFVPQIIETVDEDGNKIELELIEIFNVDGIEYALLKLVDEDEEEDEEYDEAVLMRLLQTSDEYLFVAIEDDEEFERVSKYIEELNESDELEE